MKAIEKQFNNYLLPFMADGKWHTAKQLINQIPPEYQKKIIISQLLANVFRETYILERVDRKKIYFRNGIKDNSHWAYRLVKTLAKVPSKKAECPCIQLALDLEVKPLIQDLL